MALNVDQFEESHLSDLSALTGEPLVTSEDEQSARACLAVAWENVKEAGSSLWELETAPSLALTILLSAAARAWMNLGGFTDERADAVALVRAEGFANGAELTPDERDKLGRLLGKDKTVGTLKSTPIVTLSTVDRTRESERPWWERNVMVYGPTISPTSAHPIPYLPGDEARTAKAGDVMPYIPGTIPGFDWDNPLRNRTRRW